MRRGNYLCPLEHFQITAYPDLSNRSHKRFSLCSSGSLHCRQPLNSLMFTRETEQIANSVPGVQEPMKRMFEPVKVFRDGSEYLQKCV